jgi:hypothetical protein
MVLSKLVFTLEFFKGSSTFKKIPPIKPSISFKKLPPILSSTSFYQLNKYVRNFNQFFS